MSLTGNPLFHRQTVKTLRHVTVYMIIAYLNGHRVCEKGRTCRRTEEE